MHTLKVIFGGFLLLGVCLLLGRWIGGAAATVVATTIKYFLVLWLAATLVNMWVGVSKAGYSIFNADLFYEAQMWAQSVIRSGNSSLALRLLGRLFHYLYLLLPMVHVFGKKTENIYSSLRVVHGEWRYPLFSLGYALALAAFCYFLALFALQRKNHI